MINCFSIYDIERGHALTESSRAELAVVSGSRVYKQKGCWVGKEEREKFAC